MPKKLLLLSYSFPPQATPEAFLSAKTLGGLKDYQIDVICASPSLTLLPNDPSLDSYVSHRFKRVIGIDAPGWLQWAYHSKNAARTLTAAFQFPDRMAPLNWQAAQAAERLDLSSYIAMISWSQFHSSHLAALRIKKLMPSLRWIAHFSDPWADNPFNRLKLITQPYNRVLEARVLSTADHLVFTSELTVDLVLRNYPDQMRVKTSVIPHPYDPALYPDSASLPHSETKVWRYLGNFYGNRSPLPLLKALKQIQEAEPVLLEGVRFEFVGPATGWNDDARKLGLKDDLVRFLPPVPYVKSLELMGTADVLLVIDAPAESSVFLPSKLVDYLGAHKPIFGITPPGTSADLIEEIGGWIANPGHLEEVTEKLKVALRTSGAPAETPTLNAARKRYHVDTIANQMLSLIEKQEAFRNERKITQPVAKTR